MVRSPSSFYIKKTFRQLPLNSINNCIIEFVTDVAAIVAVLYLINIRKAPDLYLLLDFLEKNYINSKLKNVPFLNYMRKFM